jgi:hypothetical protein
MFAEGQPVKVVLTAGADAAEEARDEPEPGSTARIVTESVS